MTSAACGGDNYHRIAERLFIAPSIVRTHLATIYRKLGVSSKIELHKVLEGRSPQYVTQGDQAAVISELALSLEEAITRERTLGEILKIISGSSGELEKVIAAVLGYTLELCDAEFGILFEYTAKSGCESKYTKGIPQPFEDWLAMQGAFQVGSQTGLGQIIASRDVVNIADVCAEEIYRAGNPLRNATAELGGARSFAAIPMLAGERLIGAFTVYRQQVRPFDTKSLEVARMFAD